MSPNAALLSAIDALRAAYQAALDPLCGGRVFWLASAEEARLPLIVLQSQDGGGAPQPYIGSVTWTGQVAVRCFETTQVGASALARQAATAISESLRAGELTVTSRLVRPLIAPPARQAYVAGWLYAVTVA